MTIKSKALTPADTQKLMREKKKFTRLQWIAPALLLVFYVIVFVASSMRINAAEHVVFTGMCFMAGVVAFIFPTILKGRLDKDLSGGLKQTVSGKVNSKYSKRADDYFGSFVLNGKRYYAEGEAFQRIEPDTFIEIEVGPNSRMLLGIC